MESIYGPRTDGPSTALTSLTSRNSHGTSRNSRNSLLHGESHQAATSAAFRPTKSNSTHVSTGFFLPGPRRRQNEWKSFSSPPAGDRVYSRRRGQDLNSGRQRGLRRKIFFQGISVLPEENSLHLSNNLRIVSMTHFSKYFQNDAIYENRILAVFGLFKCHGPMREQH